MDYLMKPVETEELKQTVAKVLEKRKNTPNQKLEFLLENLSSPKKEFKKIAVSSWEGLQFIKLEDIVYMEASGNYTNVFILKQKKYLSSRTLKDYEELLPSDTFIRIHNSYIINKDYIERYIRGEGGQVVIEGNIMLDVSKRKKADFLQAIGY
jgi:two-component system LytT family response regulator